MAIPVNPTQTKQTGENYEFEFVILPKKPADFIVSMERLGYSEQEIQIIKDEMSYYN